MATACGLNLRMSVAHHPKGPNPSGLPPYECDPLFSGIKTIEQQLPISTRAQTEFSLGEITNKLWRTSERNGFVIWATLHINDSFGASGSADRLFPDRSGLQYGRHSEYDRPSAVEPLGNLHSSRARFLDRQQ